MTGVVFDPLLPLWGIWLLAALAVAASGLAFWRARRGAVLRAGAVSALLLALVNPSFQSETRAPLSDIVIAVVDGTASQSLRDRPDQTQAALMRLRAEVAALANTELRVIPLGDAPEDGGTRAMEALGQAMANEPRGRIAGAFLISDGRVHDVAAAPDMPAPLHLLQTGRAADWDRRLTLRNAPAFAIVGEETRLTLRIEEEGAVPDTLPQTARVTLSLDAEPPVTTEVPVGQDIDLPITLTHGGMNILHAAIAPVEGEMTDRNNAQIVQINGVRDRLRVLLVSGEPHAGERVWRNLLTSDPSVDLVHFTILRPPEKQDGTPIEELALIAFPTRELFMEKIDAFDLIIFDRYRLRGILPYDYLENMRDYVRRGGTVLVAAGPEFAGVDSLARSPLGEIMPARPTGRVLEEAFVPGLTDTGRRHPVTAPLSGDWGPWLRQVELTPAGSGEVLMDGIDGRPLLVLDRVGEGRIAVLGSDQIWLWGRGYEGGGPQLDLTRRLAHWMLKEPELEEEALTATASGAQVAIERRSVADAPPGPLTVTGPEGEETVLTLTEAAPGRFAARWDATGPGLYRMRQDNLEAVFAVGPPAPREFAETVAGTDTLAPVLTGSLRLEEAPDFDIRAIGAGRTAQGRGWLGITPRGAHDTEGVRVLPILPAWGWLALALALILGAWLREGRFTPRRAG
ncbi:glutamine amidotransferase [Falsirhodobacter halotolerans]|uniref:glutamine amidotransferase n=1 Tax=Falsirhodobacter halotolerans TaxID=1146892 RepID=UPI001FD3CA93|nr:glutamine amidotransferase [Falsirhodobacter halotolerans]MCJ8138801.1 glutamine amidotransferase [Falsirhodobacter halotolerans]